MIGREAHMEKIVLPGTPKTGDHLEPRIGWVKKDHVSDGLCETFTFDPLGNMTNRVDLSRPGTR